MAETRRRGRMTAWLAAVVACSLLSIGSTPSSAQAAADDADRVPAVLALLYAPQGTSLASILDGTARVGFTPLITPGAPLRLERETAAWLRLRADLPERADGEWVLRIQPAPIRRARSSSRIRSMASPARAPPACASSVSPAHRTAIRHTPTG